VERLRQAADVVVERIRGQRAQDRERFGNAHPAQADRKDGQHHQRDGHPGEDAVVLRRMLGGLGARPAKECHHNLPRGIERGQQRGEGQHKEDDRVPVPPGVGQDFVLRPETRSDEREAAQRETTQCAASG